MNVLSREKRKLVLKCLLDGNSIRATVRISGVSKNAVTRLLIAAGKACATFQDRKLRNLSCKRVEVDEVWCFVGRKERNVPLELKGQGLGDHWTWVSLCADSKLVVCWLIGDRDTGHAVEFLRDLRSRLPGRVQLTSDGHRPYLEGVEVAWGGDDIDYAQLVKIYGSDPVAEKRYSPAVCIGAKPTPVVGNPDPAHISTSYIERQNWTLRTNCRRYTRLSNGFSRKAENLQHAVSIHFMNYNFCRIHNTLRVTPAMAAGVTDRLWRVDDMIDLIEKMK